MKKVIAIISLFVICLSAGAKGWYYQNLMSPDEASRDFVCALVQPRGYAWGGTRHGLFRYGYGNDYRWYRAGDSNTSLPGDNIYNMELDSQGRLWVFTDKGIAQYLSAIDGFSAMVTRNESGTDVPVIGFCSLKASDGNVYIGGLNELYVYSVDDDRVVKTIPLGIGKSFRIDAIFEPFDNGVIGLFNKENGFALYYLKTGKVEITQVPLVANNAYMVDSHKRFWRSQYNRGVEVYEDQTLVATYNTSNSALSSNLVTCFLENNGEIWIGTDGGGINILNPDTGKISHLMRTPGDFNSFPCSSIIQMCIDASNAVWAIRPDGSILLLKDSYMRTLAFSPVYDQLGRTSDEVLCIAQSKSRPNIAWIGTAASGLYGYDISKTGADTDIRKVDALGNRRIESLLTLPNDDLLIFSADEGLLRYTPSNNVLRQFTEIKDQEFYDKIKYHGQSVSLGMDNLGHVTILADDAYIWDLATNRIVKNPVPVHEGHDAIYPVSHGEGKYFFCEKYLYQWDAKAYRHEWIYEIEDDNHINSVSRDSFGTFWMATDKGLFKLPNGESVATRMDFDQITGAEVVIVDNQDRVWIATHSAMYAYLPQLESLMRFGDNDGVNWNKYNGKSWLYTDECILLGGVNGLLHVDPSVNFFLTDKPEITVQDLVLNGTKLNKIPSKLTLTSSYKSLNMRLFVRENNILRDKQFRFILTNRRKDSIIDTDLPELSLSLLPAGTHTLSACCTLQNGSWTEPVELLQLRVMPLWYKSWWFWIVVVIFAILFIYLLLRSYKSDADYKLALAASEAENKAGQDSLKFLLNVSHELKTPLTLIISPLSRLLKNKDKSDPEYNTLSNVLRQANRMSSLILTVLDSHKIKDGSASFNGEIKKLNEWVDEHASDFEEEAQSRHINLVKSFDPAVTDAEIDPQKLENVITNMMINALKHSPDNTTITVGTSLLPDTHQYRVFVSDEGEGLGGVDMTKLFSRFYQGYAQKSGSGLGLAYANSIVEMHRGTMGACENKTKGATFYFDLPIPGDAVVASMTAAAAVEKPSSRASHFQQLAKSLDEISGSGENEEPVVKAAAAAPAVAPAKKEEPKKVEPQPVNRAVVSSIADATILVVDDDSDLREYLMDELSAVASNVVSAANGQKALDIVKSQKIDVVVSDVMMPVMDGFELTDKIKRDPNLCDTPVILLTARVEAKSREHGLSLGADSYLPKPFDKDLLIKAINNILAQ